jgi:cyclopropane-fatty-acyl-phospholipid synthase
MTLKHELDRMLRHVRGMNFRVQFWDGDTIAYGAGEGEFLLRLPDLATVKWMLGDVLVRLPDAYVAGQLEVEGDIRGLLRLCYAVDPRVLDVGPLRRAVLAAAAFRQRNSPAGARANVSHHYDLGNAFFSLWLDADMVYSCAYFEHPADDLETAQRQKIEHLCRKLRLEAGHRLLDIGCGWGALAMHAARAYEARIVGITLSEEQRALSQKRIDAAGLGGRVEVRRQDYRELPASVFDRVVSVGMIEHVGQAYIGGYLAAVRRCLRPGGVGVIQTISQSRPGPTTPWITRRIFPGMYLPTLGELAAGMAREDLRVVDVENLKPHYALTLDGWIDRFEKQVDRVRAMFDERFVRMWRMYLHSASAAFRHGGLNLWQITFTHGPSDAIPLTRRHQYREAEGARGIG